MMLSRISFLGVEGINKLSKPKYLSIGDLELVKSKSSGSDERKDEQRERLDQHPSV